MLVLGLADNHDSGAAIVQDGVLKAATGQERLDRVKNSGAFPWEAAEAVLAQVGAAPSDVDVVVFGGGYTPSTILRALPRVHARARGDGSFSYLLNLYIFYQVAQRRTGMYRAELAASRALLSRRLAGRGFGGARIFFMDHHEAHAQAAYRSQPHRRCLVLTLDAMGDGASATAWEGRDGSLCPLGEQSGLAAINTFYSRITEYLGFRPNRHEGKITGLAAYTAPPAQLVRHMERMLRFRGTRFNRLNVLARQHPRDSMYSRLSLHSREEVASAAQAVLERAVCGFVRHWVQRTGLGHVAVAGGIFANVKLNQRIAGMEQVEDLFIYPNMGDGGLPVGAALGHVSARPSPLENMYLGPAYTSQQVEFVLRSAGLQYSRPSDLDGRVVELLMGGKVVARFDGAMEWGPRALGNRSILYRPDEPSVNDWLNQRLRRTEFMPFAPLTLAEDAPRLYLGLDKAREAARFMTICFDCTDTMKRTCPGVVHVDGTARPQVVSHSDNPRLHRLLSRFKSRTGLGTLVNTSFNMHEEPIVCSPADAMRAWKDAHLDAMIMGPFLVERRDGQH